MLTELTIHNFGLIDDISIEFSKGLNTLTGETGAGKSIIIGALRYVLGERLNSSQIHDTTKECSVEAIYQIDNKVLIIKRTYTPEGRTKIKVSGDSVTVGQLKELGDTLTDFHGPHDHQMLLNNDNHIFILDRLANFESDYSNYKNEFKNLCDLQTKLNILSKSSQNREREIDTLLFQISELEEVPLDQEKHDQLYCEQKRINNTEALFKHASTLLQILDNDELSISTLLRNASSELSSINNIDDSTEKLANTLDIIQDNCSELSSSINNYCDSLSFDQQQAQEINDICDKYNLLKRKYGNSFEELLTFYNTSKEKLLTLQDFDLNDEALRTQIETSTQMCNKLAAKISKQRKATAKVLEKSLKVELKDLGIKNIEFECRFSKCDLKTNGYDELIFYISPNVGEELKPLAEIVSSGEAARIMLALKKVLTDVDPIPVLIFDEIDAQIGGRLGTIIGQKLIEIAKQRQVILITHLPQIATFANQHLKVEKSAKANKTLIEVKKITGKEQQQELTEMAGGKV